MNPSASAHRDSSHPGQELLYPAPPAVINGGLIFPGINGRPRCIYDTDTCQIPPFSTHPYFDK